MAWAWLQYNPGLFASSRLPTGVTILRAFFATVCSNIPFIGKGQGKV